MNAIDDLAAAKNALERHQAQQHLTPEGRAALIREIKAGARALDTLDRGENR